MVFVCRRTYRELRKQHLPRLLLSEVSQLNPGSNFSNHVLVENRSGWGILVSAYPVNSHPHAHGREGRRHSRTFGIERRDSESPLPDLEVVNDGSSGRRSKSIGLWNPGTPGIGLEYRERRIGEHGIGELHRSKQRRKKITSITVNNKYNIEDIFPGDTIKIHDLGYTVSDLQILKVTYNPESVDLELGVLESIGNAVFNP